MVKESFSPEEVPAKTLESQGEPENLKKRILSGKVGKIARGTALLGALAFGAEAVVPSSVAGLEKTHQLTADNTVDREEARRNKEIASWLTELGYTGVRVERDRRASGMFGEVEYYHIDVTVGNKNFSFIMSTTGRFQKDHFQEDAKKKIERASFANHIEIDPDAREVMAKIGVDLEGENLIYDRGISGGQTPRPPQGVSLYSSGENVSVQIRKRGPRSLELIITEKNGKVLHYEITSGHLDPIEK